METSIPINYYLAAAKDTELKKLLRAKATASARVQRALEAEQVAEDAIAAHVAATYPPSEPAEAESA